ncbi:MAG: hypothetical protein ACI9SE_003499 [Neolewinella sp.]|jgi:hypothetical protein
MIRCLQTLVAVSAFALPTLSQTNWQRVPLLEHISDPAFAFDTIRDVAVVFGGETQSGILDATWTWDRVSWSHAITAHTPPARRQASMVFDPVRCVTVLFGGRDSSNNYLGDTWLFDGVDWTQATPAQSPSPRVRHAMTFDQANATVLLFGGSSTIGSEMQDTWQWNGSNWILRTPAHQPPVRAGAKLAYDSIRQRTVLFGGSCFLLGPCWRSDTWEWDGTDWTDRSPTWPITRPPGRWLHGLTYDIARQRVVLFGGSDEPHHYKDDLWEWDGTTWVERVLVPRPAARLGFGLAYDPIAQRTLAFGGETWPGDRLSDLWSFDGTAWQLAAAGMQPPLAIMQDLEASTFDGDRSVIVWLGQTFLDPSLQIWEWSGAGWSKRSFAVQPSASGHHRLRWLPRRHRVVLHQPPHSQLPEQTWEYDGTSWTLLTTAHSPGVREGFDVALDVDFTRLLLFGGRDLQGLRNSTWALTNGDWQLLTTTGPTAREGHTMALDAHRGRVVMFGGKDNSGLLADTYEWDGQQWTQMQPATSPPARREQVMSYDVARRRIVMHGGGSAPGDDTWEWDGSDWQQRITTTSWHSYSHTMAHDFSRGETIAFGGYKGGTWRYAPTHPASFETFGSGCDGSLGPLSIWTPLGGLAYTDGSFTVAFGNVPGSIAFAAAGYSATSWNGVSLPINLQPIGAPNCNLLVAAESQVALPVTGGVATWTLQLPAAPALIGVSLFQQALALDPNGPNGLAMTPASVSVVGGR